MNRFAQFASFGVLAAIAAPAMAGSHLWRFNEFFTTADGSVQFIELVECCGADSEIFLQGKWIRSLSGGDYTFPSNLDCCTANRSLLLATQTFADLPGAPTPDFIIEPSFFSLDGDEMKYWMYAAAEFTYGAGDMPSDGILSMDVDLSTAANSPTNFAGETGSVVASCDPADLNADGEVSFADLLILLGDWGPCFCASDTDRSGEVDFADLLALLGAWGPC